MGRSARVYVCVWVDVWMCVGERYNKVNLSKKNNYQEWSLFIVTMSLF